MSPEDFKSTDFEKDGVLKPMAFVLRHARENGLPEVPGSSDVEGRCHLIAEEARMAYKQHLKRKNLKEPITNRRITNSKAGIMEGASPDHDVKINDGHEKFLESDEAIRRRSNRECGDAKKVYDKVLEMAISSYLFAVQEGDQEVIDAFRIIEEPEVDEAVHGKSDGRGNMTTDGITLSIVKSTRGTQGTECNSVSLATDTNQRPAFSRNGLAKIQNEPKGNAEHRPSKRNRETDFEPDQEPGQEEALDDSGILENRPQGTGVNDIKLNSSIGDVEQNHLAGPKSKRKKKGFDSANMGSDEPDSAGKPVRASRNLGVESFLNQGITEKSKDVIEDATRTSNLEDPQSYLELDCHSGAMDAELCYNTFLDLMNAGQSKGDKRQTAREKSSRKTSAKNGN